MPELKGTLTSDTIVQGATGVTKLVQLENADGSPATGLTHSTSGLKIYGFRTDLGSVQITLVTQTPTGAWTSGGFCAVDETNCPGLYRLDVPNGLVV